MKKQAGFSLIEILIALTILAIALTAALVLATRTGKNILRTKERILAQWVAENTLANIQMGRLHLQDDRPVTGSETELNQTFYYRAFVSMQYANSEEINIQVGVKESQPLLTLEGWYWHNSQEGEP